MSFQTRRFGEIEVPEDKIIRFAGGIPGLECMSRCILIKVEETLPFYWLQSAIDGGVALPVINPLLIDSGYAPSVEESVFEELQIEKGREEDLLVVNVAVIPEDLKKMTANMAAPLLINIVKNLGKQVILDSSPYQMRQPIYDAVCQSMKEERDRAGTDQKGE